MNALHVPEIPPGTSPHRAAQLYAEAGLHVLPIAPGGKHAGSLLGYGWQLQTTTDLAVIDRWFGGGWFRDCPDPAVALHPGPSGAVAFDVDTPEKIPPVLRAAIDQLSPPFQSTRADVPGRGHYLLGAPAGSVGSSLGGFNTPKGEGWGEIRAYGGIVVASPTPHEKAAQGGRYEWLRTGPIPAAPPDLLACLRPPGVSGGSVSPGDAQQYLDQFADGEPCAKVQTADLEPPAAGSSDSHHVWLTDLQTHLVALGSEGHRGVREALDTARDNFLNTGGTSTGRNPSEGEWYGALKGAVAKRIAVSPGPITGACNCDIDAYRAALLEQQRAQLQALELPLTERAGMAPPPDQPHLTLVPPTTPEATPMTPLPGPPPGPFLPHPKGQLGNWSPLFANRLPPEFFTQPPPPPMSWALRGLLRKGDLGALVAGAKSGKSLLTYDRALEAAASGLVVVYFDAENGEHDILRRTHDLGYRTGVPPTLHYFSFPMVTLDSEAGALAFGNWAVQMYNAIGRIDVVVLDTASRFLEGDENDSGPWLQMYRRAFLPLKRGGIAVLRLDHTGKDESKGARGSSTKTQDVDVVIQLTVRAERGLDRRWDANGQQVNGTDERVAELELETTHQRSGTYPEKARVLRSTVGGVLGHRATTAAQASLVTLAQSDDQEALSMLQLLRKRDPDAKWGYRKARDELAYKFDEAIPEAKWRKVVNIHKRAVETPDEDPDEIAHSELSTTPDGLANCGAAVGANEDPLPRGAPQSPQSTAVAAEENNPQVTGVATAAPQFTAPHSTVPLTAPAAPFRVPHCGDPTPPQSSTSPADDGADTDDDGSDLPSDAYRKLPRSQWAAIRRAHGLPHPPTRPETAVEIQRAPAGKRAAPAAERAAEDT